MTLEKRLQKSRDPSMFGKNVLSKFLSLSCNSWEKYIHLLHIVICQWTKAHPCILKAFLCLLQYSLHYIICCHWLNCTSLHCHISILLAIPAGLCLHQSLRLSNHTCLVVHHHTVEVVVVKIDLSCLNRNTATWSLPFTLTHHHKTEIL